MSYYNPEPPYQHGDTLKVGILLANLGTPDAPTAPALRRYLGQFLMDTRVVEIPRFIWCWILHCIILVVRPKKSAAKYAQVWTSEGSPLLANAQKQTQLLRVFLAQKIIISPLKIPRSRSFKRVHGMNLRVAWQHFLLFYTLNFPTGQPLPITTAV